MSDMRKLIEQVEKLTEEADTSGIGYVVHINDSDGDRYDCKGNIDSGYITKARIFLSLKTATDAAEQIASYSDGTVTVKSVIIRVDNDVRRLKGKGK